jgi:nitrate/TMAO reductase-like tetraheme cytochrome c subunit
VPSPLRLPAAVRNPISFLGIGVATTMAVLFLVLLLLEAVGAIENPYIGLLVFVTVPLLFVLGLLLIPIGSWWSARRRRLHPERSEWPTIDLRNPHHRRVTVAVLALTLVNVLIVSIAAGGAVHYMGSSQFCGQVCHVTMEPEYAAYQVWPHARVACADCHVGPGVGALVQAKLAGTRQLYHVITNQVPKPVPPPEQLIRPARDTCERCHWPEKFHGDKLRVIREYGNDEKNSETVTTLQLHVGGGSAQTGIGSGIHWHMNLDNRIEFVAVKDEIPFVRLTDRAGRVRDFVGEKHTAQEFASAPLQRMDCMDCHNRPAHSMFFTPERAIDTAIARGAIPRELAFVRREAVAAVSATYADRAAAIDGIASRLKTFYAGREGSDARLVARAIAGAQDVWARNVFPAMAVKWGTYPNNIGHVDAPGCFRCHDDSHKASDGSTIRQDCELCHSTT